MVGEVLGTEWTPLAGRRSTLSSHGRPRDPSVRFPAQSHSTGVNSTWLYSQPRHQLPVTRAASKSIPVLGERIQEKDFQTCSITYSPVSWRSLCSWWHWGTLLLSGPGHRPLGHFWLTPQRLLGKRQQFQGHCPTPTPTRGHVLEKSHLDHFLVEPDVLGGPKSRSVGPRDG